MKMERVFTEVTVPPSRICGVCRNRMVDLCVEDCAPANDYKYFKPDDRQLDKTPVLSMEEFRQLNGRVKGEWLFYQLSKITEYILEGEDGHHIYRAPSGRLLTNIKGEDLLSHPEKRDTAHPNRKERQGAGEPASFVASEPEIERT